MISTLMVSSCIISIGTFAVLLSQQEHQAQALAMSASTPSAATNKQSQGGRFVGFDLGTSGARISIIEPATNSAATEPFEEVYTQAITWNDQTLDIGGYDDADAWWKAVETLLDGAAKDDKLAQVVSMCISGTSASCLLVDKHTLEMTRPPRMYNYDVVGSASTDEERAAGQHAVDLLDKYAPPRHTARAKTGSLAKLLSWAKERPLSSDEVLCHQSDFISANLMGKATPVSSDWHNCLKLGYDVRNKAWPRWMDQCFEDAGIVDTHQPAKTPIPMGVVSPGKQMGTVCDRMCQRFGLPAGTTIVGGTTDSNAAFFAAAGTKPAFGTAVTSLGSTLAMKQLSETYVEDADRGVYSHRFPTFSGADEDAWLVGGASNVGCAILRQLDFSVDELQELSAIIDPNTDSPLSYYPLTKVGERFPIADGSKEPVLEPVPDSRQEYLHGILQSIGDVERDGFQVLKELGSSQPTTVYTCGGGSRNDMWSKLRKRRLNEAFHDGASIDVLKADSTEASYGAALLAAATFT